MVPRNRGCASGSVGKIRVTAWVNDRRLTASATTGPDLVPSPRHFATTTNTSGASPVTSMEMPAPR